MNPAREALARVADARVALVLVVVLGVAAEFASASSIQLWSFVLVNMLAAQSINILT